MKRFFLLQLTVYGRIGSETVWDRSGDSPAIKKLHYEFDFRPDSELFKTFPVFIVSGRLGSSLAGTGFSGFEIAQMKITVSEDFRRLNPGQVKPSDFHWLKVYGKPLVDDFGVGTESMLAISEQVLNHLGSFQIRDYLKYDADTPLRPHQLEDDLFAEARKALREDREGRT